METQDYLGHRRRIRKRFLSQGLDVFTDYEALELLLTWLIPRKDVKPIAKRLIRSYGNFRSSLDTPHEDLMKIEGIGESTATGIKFFREVIDRYLREQAFEEPLPEDFAPLKVYCRTALGNLPIEVFHVFCLDTGRRILADEQLERGTIDRAAVYPRQVIDFAMRHGASYLVLAHNHPNGDPRPTKNDEIITRAIVLSGAPLDIHVYDHLIVTADDLFSFREAGLL